MSLQSLTSQHKITVYRLADGDDARGDAGAVDKSDRWATTGTVYSCRIQPASSYEKIESMQRGYEISHVIYFSSEPAVGNDDKIVYGTRTFLAVGTATDTDELGRLWKLQAMEAEQF